MQTKSVVDLFLHCCAALYRLDCLWTLGALGWRSVGPKLGRRSAIGQGMSCQGSMLESGSGREMTWGEEKKVCRPGTWLHDPSCSSACGATLPHILHIGSLCWIMHLGSAQLHSLTYAWKIFFNSGELCAPHIVPFEAKYFPFSLVSLLLGT